MSTADIEDDDLWWGEPARSRRWHIFDGEKSFAPSLCGNWSYSHNPSNADVEPDDTYTEGDDCKACCRAAGLLEGDDD